VSVATLLHNEEGSEIQMASDGTSPAIHHVDVPSYPAAHSPYSHAVVANGFVFVSGQIPVRPEGGPTDVVGDTMQEQTRQALRNLETALKAAGSSLNGVVRVNSILPAGALGPGIAPLFLLMNRRRARPDSTFARGHPGLSRRRMQPTFEFQ
jgi:hypothetical protein